MSSLRVLVADDDEDMRTWLYQVLSSCGAEVCEAADGDEALWNLGNNGPYDAFIVDEHMPSVPGHFVAGALRTVGLATPILMISAGPGDKLAALVAQLPGAAFLAKPLRREDVESWCAGCSGARPERTA